MNNRTSKPPLETIRLERRFGGFFPVLQFTNGTLEDAAVHVYPTADLALRKAQDYINFPDHNVKFWTEKHG